MFTEEQAERHNSLISAAGVILKEYALTAEQPIEGRLSFLTRRKLRHAIVLYEQALSINPARWNSMWAIGKLYQKLGDDRNSLAWFQKAAALKPQHVEVLREVGIAALNIGQISLGFEYCLRAAIVSPDDLGLQCNLALAYLLQGDNHHALECAKVAASRMPDDQEAQNVLKLVLEISEGKRKRPASLNEL